MPAEKQHACLQDVETLSEESGEPESRSTHHSHHHEPPWCRTGYSGRQETEAYRERWPAGTVKPFPPVPFDWPVTTLSTVWVTP